MGLFPERDNSGVCIWFQIICGQINRDQIRTLSRVCPPAKSWNAVIVNNNVCYEIKWCNKTCIMYIPWSLMYSAWLPSVAVNVLSTINYQVLLIDGWNGAITFRPYFMTNHIVVGLKDTVTVWITNYLIQQCYSNTAVMLTFVQLRM